MVKQGNTEIELTGHFDSFNNTMLIAKHVVEEVNAEIKVNKFKLYFTVVFITVDKTVDMLIK